MPVEKLGKYVEVGRFSATESLHRDVLVLYAKPEGGALRESVLVRE